MVDEFSLFKVGRVRVQGRCRNPSLIKGSIEVFFNGSGIPISFVVEDSKGLGKNGKGGPSGSGSGNPRGGPDKDHDNHQQGERKRGTDKFQRFGKIDRDMDPNHDDSMDDCLELDFSNINEDLGKGVLVTPIAAFHPVLGHVSIKDNSDPVPQDIQGMSLNKDDDSAKEPSANVNGKEMGLENNMGEDTLPELDQKLCANQNQFIVHGAHGPFLMDKNKWPKLSMTIEQESQEHEGLGVLTQEDTFTQTKVTQEVMGDELSQLELLADTEENI